MRSGGWKPFWAAFGAALLVLLPLVGGTVLLSRQRLSQHLRQAAQSQSGVPVRTADADDRISILLCTVPQDPADPPGFLLLDLDAALQRIALLAIPAQTEVSFAESSVTLAQCYASAGPARCRQALAQCLPLPEDTHYLALSAGVLQQIADRYGAVRVNLSGVLSADTLVDHGLSGGVQALLAAEAQQLLSALEKDPAFSGQQTAAARASIWDAFFRQDLELLPSTLPDALRKASSRLLSDLTALDYAALEDILEFLANGSCTVQASVLPLPETAAG